MIDRLTSGDNLEPAVYALIGEASGEIQTLPAATDGAGGAGGEGGSIEPSMACDRELCMNDPDLKAQCEAVLAACLETEELNQDECLIGALLICGAE